MEQVHKLFLGNIPRTIEFGDKLSNFEAMRLAIAEAWRGAGRVSPNPPVGCVILSSKNEFLAKGFHTQLGAPHAEIAALARLANVYEIRREDNEWNLDDVPMEKLRDAKVFVTLEPCSHIGKTPSCAKTFARLPIAEVIYGIKDPNPLVSGRGVEALERAKIKTRRYSEIELEHPLENELLDVCEHFLVNHEQNRPFVTLKIATSLDGVYGLRSGESQWITSELSRSFSQFFRGSHDAILVGRTTLSRDNPSYTIRHPHFSDMKKKIVVVDMKGSLLQKTDLKIFRLHSPENLLWCVGEDYDETPKFPVELIRIPDGESGVSLRLLHEKLFERGIRSLFVESGGKTLAAHLKAQAADRLMLFQSPTILGTDNGRVWTEGYGILHLGEALRLERINRAILGIDLLTTGRIRFPADDYANV